ncbi:hypothetical protein SAMN06265379_103309 [Saccharicrinis carchari]|uniref:Uncharacterized protein n=1 Tax=Saccharicrinis carchari TaxID=1168039 RepID=A0A521CMN5_SACCC|nr:hypothetical protein [Saccharicrinis carchari]SMO60713.1 hypothetical protein SAMN06265379_103309 [Saccharicrinis carchari]
MATNELRNRILLYLALFLVLLIFNLALAHFHYSELLNKVGEIKLFLLVLFSACAFTIKWTKKNFNHFYLSVFLVSIGVKMLASLVYLWPVMERDWVEKDIIALVFMANYLIYLNFFVMYIVKE